MPEELVICELFTILNKQHKQTVADLNLQLYRKEEIVIQIMSKEKTLIE
jgi:hypothetical protein